MEICKDKYAKFEEIATDCNTHCDSTDNNEGSKFDESSVYKFANKYSHLNNN